MRHFDRLDANGDGILTGSDLRRHAQAALDDTSSLQTQQRLLQVARAAGVERGVLSPLQATVDANVRSGDYLAASAELEKTTRLKDVSAWSDSRLGDAALVRRKVADLLKLAEMKWRVTDAPTAAPHAPPASDAASPPHDSHA